MTKELTYMVVRMFGSNEPNQILYAGITDFDEATKLTDESVEEGEWWDAVIIEDEELLKSS